ncbi:MAG: amidohydrolase family protein [Parcubacteria group bacterium]|nr:amidohydrolase family protein [Parcubacteria group bacterium]
MLDLVIKNGTIINGTGQEKFKANIGVKKDKIKIISKSNLRGRKVIDAKNLYITPGFVDILNHTDGYLTLFNDPKVSSMVMQGVTTMICGNCGTSLAPLAPKSTLSNIFKNSFTKTNVVIAPSQGESLLKNVERWTNTTGVNITWVTFEEYLNEIENQGIACNFATLVGYNTCRRIVTGDEARDISYDEMKILKNMLEESLSSGALGISIGLSYSHANFIKINEIHRLFSILKSDRKICAIHLRDENEDFEEALQEVFKIASKGDISVEVSHLKIPPTNNGIDKILEKFNKEKEKGVNVNFDFYPYERAWTTLYSYLPKWVTRGGKSELVERLKDKENRAQIIKELRESSIDYKNFVITYSPYNKTLVGKKIGDIASEQNISEEETVIDLLISSNADLICFSGDNFVKPYNLYKQIKSEHSIIASDGAAYSSDYKEEEQLVHPRCFGAFPRFLNEYVVNKKLINWEEAIRKITYMPAKKVGLSRRGLIERDYFADLVVIDPEKIGSEANYNNPYKYPTGINSVIINGRIAANGGKQKDNLFGKVLKG